MSLSAKPCGVHTNHAYLTLNCQKEKNMFVHTLIFCLPCRFFKCPGSPHSNSNSPWFLQFSIHSIQEGFVIIYELVNSFGWIRGPTTDTEQLVVFFDTGKTTKGFINAFVCIHGQCSMQNANLKNSAHLDKREHWLDKFDKVAQFMKISNVSSKISYKG